MGLCAWRDKEMYFDSSERETRVRMLQKYLDKSKAPQIAGRPSFISECLVNSLVELADSGNPLGVVYEGGESSEDQADDFQTTNRRTQSLPSKQPPNRPNLQYSDTFDSPSVNWPTLESAERQEQDSGVSEEQSASQATYLFLRSATLSQPPG